MPSPAANWFLERIAISVRQCAAVDLTPHVVLYIHVPRNLRTRHVSHKYLACREAMMLEQGELPLVTLIFQYCLQFADIWGLADLMHTAYEAERLRSTQLPPPPQNSELMSFASSAYAISPRVITITSETETYRLWGKWINHPKRKKKGLSAELCLAGSFLHVPCLSGDFGFPRARKPQNSGCRM